MPSSRHAAFTAGALLALALFLALAGGLGAQCPPPGGYRSTDAGTDRFSGIKTTRTHLPPVYGPAVPNLYAFAKKFDIGMRQMFSGARPINGPEDLKGLKMRTAQSPVDVSMYKALNATPTPQSSPNG